VQHGALEARQPRDVWHLRLRQRPWARCVEAGPGRVGNVCTAPPRPQKPQRPQRRPRAPPPH
jgi:hypothetical protein